MKYCINQIPVIGHYNTGCLLNCRIDPAVKNVILPTPFSPQSGIGEPSLIFIGIIAKVNPRVMAATMTSKSPQSTDRNGPGSYSLSL
jgi:hypothetical protein